MTAKEIQLLVPTGWRLLAIGEVVKENDSYYDSKTLKWIPTRFGNLGIRVDHIRYYIRKLN